MSERLPYLAFLSVVADGLESLLAFIVGLVCLFCLWAYAVLNYGWFLGLGLGWIPAAVLSVAAGLATFFIYPKLPRPLQMVIAVPLSACFCLMAVVRREEIERRLASKSLNTRQKTDAR